jgi:hypothetical protein
VKSPTKLAYQLGDTSLNKRVHVFIVGRQGQPTVSQFIFNSVERTQQCSNFGEIEKATATKAANVSPRPSDIVASEPAVDVKVAGEPK